MARSRKVGSDFPRRRTASSITGLGIHVSISRESNSRSVGTYYACASVDKRGSRRRETGGGSQCARGSAPRRALAAAMRRLAKTLDRRSSAFKGIK